MVTAKKQQPEKEKKGVFTTGKRRKAVARACFRDGKGIVKINSRPLSLVPNEIVRLKMQEPLILAGEAWKKYDIDISTRGGGLLGQAEAARQAIAKGLAELLGKDIKDIFMEYDRNLIAYDPRRTEPHKPPHSSWGPRRYKQRSKR